MYNIAKYPEIQEKVQKEVDEVFAMSRSEPTTLAKLNELTYLELVIKETLRLYPSVPIIGRLASEDIELSGSQCLNQYQKLMIQAPNSFLSIVISANKRIVPKGANVLIPILPMHYDDEIFDAPREFRPKRFLEERSTKTVNPFAYVPFSAGPRNCIGQKFAMYELKSIVSKILRNFEISVTKQHMNEDMPPVIAELILRPGPINFYFKKRRT